MEIVLDVGVSFVSLISAKGISRYENSKGKTA
jgi:hypothetical protein